MTKQTAVEWLIEQYVDSAGILSPIDIQNALQMEREQIEVAYMADSQVSNDEVDDLWEMATTYYEQTYGKEASNES